jgi:hypothetical protein
MFGHTLRPPDQDRPHSAVTLPFCGYCAAYGHCRHCRAHGSRRAGAPVLAKSRRNLVFITIMLGMLLAALDCALQPRHQPIATQVTRRSKMSYPDVRV